MHPWLVLLVLLLVLAVGLAHPAGPALDARLFGAINRLALPTPIELALRLTSHLGLMPTNLLLWAAVWALADRRAGWLGGTGMLAAWATCWILKAATGRPRPFQALEGARLVAAVAPSGSSFPSSHTALVVYTAVTATHVLGLGGARAAAAYGLALVVAFSRVYLGAHYPSDVLAGAAIGLGAALGARSAPRHLPTVLDRLVPPLR